MEWLVPIVDAVLGSLVRSGLMMITGFLLERHLVSQQIADQFVSDGVTHVLIAVPAVLAFAWSVWVKVRGRARFLTALQATPGTTEDQVKEKVAAGMGVSVKTGALLLACVLGGAAALTLPACASHAPTKAAAVADNATKVQQSANVILHAAQQGNAVLMPNGRPLVSEQQLVDVALVVNKVGHLGQDLKRALEDYAAAVKADADIGLQRAVASRILLDISTTLADVGKAIPIGTLQTIDQAIADILFVLDLVKGGLGL